MTWIVVGVMALIVAYFWLGKRHGDKHVRTVAQITSQSLQEMDEPEGAVKKFIESMEFAVIAKSSFGKLSAFDAMGEAVGRYYEKRQKWVEIAEKYPD